MAFGFDPSIILGATPTQQATPEGTLRTLADLATQRMQQQHMQAQLADMAYKRQKEMSLADIARQTAGNFVDPTAAAYARGGFGAEAADAAQQSQARDMAAQKLLALHTDILRSQAATIKTPEQYDAWIAKVPAELRTQYGLPDKHDPAALEAFRKSGITPEQQAQLEQQKAALENTERHQATQEKQGWAQLAQGRYSIHGVPGLGGYKIDQRTGKTEFLGAPDPELMGGKGQASSKEEMEWLARANKALNRDAGKGSLLPQLQNRLNASERIKAAAVNPDGTVKDLSPAMIQELATSTAALLANGVPGEHSISALLPKGRSMKAADIAEWATNNPHGAGQQKWVKMMIDLANREEGTINGQIQEAQLRQLPSLAPGLKKFPSVVNAVRGHIGSDFLPLVDPETFLPLPKKGEGGKGGGAAKGTTTSTLKPGQIRGKDGGIYEKINGEWHEVTGDG